MCLEVGNELPEEVRQSQELLDFFAGGGRWEIPQGRELMFSHREPVLGDRVAQVLDVLGPEDGLLGVDLEAELPQAQQSLA